MWEKMCFKMWVVRSLCMIDGYPKCLEIVLTYDPFPWPKDLSPHLLISWENSPSPEPRTPH